MRPIHSTVAPWLLALAALASSKGAASAQLLEATTFLGPGAGLVTPVAMENPPGETQRLFVAELQTGRVKVVINGQVLPQPFVDLSGDLTINGERGLFDLAFHPNFAQNGKVYVSYTNAQGSSVVAEYRTKPDNPNQAEPASKRILFGPLSQPTESHNGGCIEFGPDGMLYLGLGDGGFAFVGDPQNNAQRLDTPLGKILRIDVNKLPPHVPANNPFVTIPGANPLIWHYGLRNPWRFSFDREQGDLWISDVGQFTREEINFQPNNHPGGMNFGWRCMEGTLCTGYSGCPCPPSGVMMPFHEYGHQSPDFSTFIGCSITGGYVYRGSDMPLFTGRYFFADFCTNRLWSLRRLPGGAKELLEHTADIAGAGIGNITSFAQDSRGELYILDTFQHRILRINQRPILSPGVVLPYGCGVNDPGSLTVDGGAPDLGKKLFLELGAPSTGFGAGALTALIVSVTPDANYPCGTLLPSFGPTLGLPGELLVDLGTGLVGITQGAPWQGASNPTVFTLSIPSQPALFQLPVFVQSFTYDVINANPVLSEGLLLVLGA